MRHGLHLVLLALITSLLTLPTSSSYAVTDGAVNCGTSGTFTISSNVVISQSSCTGTVQVPAGVTGIASNALNSAAITSISLPNTVTSIGSGRFNTNTTVTENCDSGKYNLAWDGSTNTIAYNGKDGGCAGNVTIPEGVTALGNSAFWTAAITSISLPDSLTLISDSALRSTSLTSLNIPANVASIGFLSIASYQITSLTFSPNSHLASIGAYAFQGVDISSITIPASVTSMDATALQSFGTLTSITFLGNAPNTNGALVINTNNTPATSILISPGATGFRESSWASYAIVQTSVISVAAIGGVTAPVTGATPVNTVTAANGYTGTISWSGSPSTFAASTSYTATITLTPTSGYTLSGVTANFFTVAGATTTNSANSGVITAIFPATAIAAPAFTLSSSSETATAGTPITGYTITSTGGTIASYSISPAIGNGLSFNTTTGLITGTPTFPANAVTYTITAHNATAPNATHTYTIAVNPQPSGCSGGGTLLITNHVLTGNTNCSGNVVIPAGVTSIGAYALQRTSITSLYIPEGVTTIGNGAFYSARTLTSVSLPTTLKTISDQAFRWTALPAVTIPAAVTYVGYLAFSNPANTLNSVNFLGDNTNAALTIASGAFQYAPLAGITLPKNLTSLDPDAFDATSSLQCIDFQGNAPTVTTNFIGLPTNPALPTVYITSGATGFTSNTPSAWKGLSVSTGLTGCISYLPGNGGTGTAPASPVKVAFGSTFTIPSNTFTALAGYSFTGWSDGANSYAASATYPTSGSVSGNVALTAQWTRGSFTVTFNNNGGSGTMAPQSSNAAASLTSNTFTLSNKRFFGWNTAANGSGTPYTDGQSYPFVTSVTLYAQWGNLISYSSSGATTGSPSRVSDNWISGTITLPTVGTMVKPGYVFAGWAATPGSSSAVANPYLPGGDITLSPIWSAKSYTLSFNSNGAASGSVPTSQSWTTGTTATTLSGNIGTPALAKTGYTFGGWATAANSSTAVTTYATASNQVFYAIWTPNSYSITYALNNGTSSLPTQASLHIYDTFTVATSATRPSYFFGGWNTAADGTGRAYQYPSIFTIGTTTPSSTTLTAQWIQAFTVHYIGNGSTTSLPTDQLYPQGQSVALAAAPTLTGYTFAGWLDSTGQLHAASSNFSVLQNSVLTAQWTPIPITITYAMNNGTSTTPTQSNLFYHNTFQVAQTPSRTGYTFGGWSDGTNTYSPGQTYLVDTSNITLTAQWSINSYAVTYEIGIGQGTLPTQSDTAFGATFTVSSTAPTLNGYSFTAWSDGTNLYAPGATYTMGAAVVTLSAQYSPLGYTTITYLPNNGVGTTPSQVALPEGAYFSLASGSALTRTGYLFAGWGDGTTTYQPGFQYYVGSYLNPIALTAQWTAIFSVTYSAGSGSGVVPTDSNQYLTNDTFSVASASGLTQSGYTFNGWSDGTSRYQPGDTYSVGSSNITLTAIWLATSPTPGSDPVSDPLQQSKIVSISPTTVITGTQTSVILTGVFIERISNISIDGYSLPSGSWTQTTSTISFPAPNLPAGIHSVQIYNGSAPVLASQNLAFDAPTAPASSATPTVPSKSPTPTPTPSPSATPAVTTVPSHSGPLRSTISLKIYFALGSYAMSDTNLLKLQNLSSKIAGLGKEITVSITGYAQPTPGSEATDGVLSQHRAAQVAMVLRENGVTTKVSYVGAGRALVDAPSSRYVEIVVKNH